MKQRIRSVTTATNGKSIRINNNTEFLVLGISHATREGVRMLLQNGSTKNVHKAFWGNSSSQNWRRNYLTLNEMSSREKEKEREKKKNIKKKKKEKTKTKDLKKTFKR